jgi:hypothetical protein
MIHRQAFLDTSALIRLYLKDNYTPAVKRHAAG